MSVPKPVYNREFARQNSCRDMTITNTIELACWFVRNLCLLFNVLILLVKYMNKSMKITWNAFPVKN